MTPRPCGVAGDASRDAPPRYDGAHLRRQRYGNGMGGMMGGSIFGSLVGDFIGSMIAELFFTSTGDVGFGESGLSAQSGNQQVHDSGAGDNYGSDWGGGDFGGDF